MIDREDYRGEREKDKKRDRKIEHGGGRVKELIGIDKPGRDRDT